MKRLSETVLVIEDNRLNLELVTDLLEANGSIVCYAPTAEEGLRLARELAVDVVLMDLGLPGMGGLAAVRVLKADPATQRLPVVALTAHAMKGDEAEARRAGCDGYLTKPIDTRTFAATVSGFIRPLEVRVSKPAVPSAASCRPGAKPTRPGGRGRVLIVDDEESNRMLLRDPLEVQGYEIVEAADGEQALAQVAAEYPDVILLDVMIPQVDGFEVCRRLKQDPRTAPIPILMVTGLSERQERLAGIAAGASDFLLKPVDTQDVILRVGNAVYTKRLFDQLQAEREKSDALLLNTLPEAIADRMKQGEVDIADYHPEVTVLMADLVGFTALSARIPPEQVVHLLSEIFSAFDQLAEEHGLEKIKTIGDAYMVAGGIPLPRADHASAVAALALDFKAEIERVSRHNGRSIEIRVGISTGPVVAGVIGRKKFAYDLWGDTVNLASRLEALGAPGQIQVSQATYERLKEQYVFEPKHALEIKGRGVETVYRLCGKAGVEETRP